MRPKSELKRLARIYRWRWYRESLVHALGLGALILIALNHLTEWPLIEVFLQSLLLSVIVFLVLGWFGHTRRVSALKWAHYLDAKFPNLQDSTELLLKKSESLNPMELLQQEYVTRIFNDLYEAGHINETLPAPRFRRIVVSLFLVALAGNAFWVIPKTIESQGLEASSAGRAAGELRVETLIVDVKAPPYTGLGSQRQKAGSFQALAGSQAQWAITLSDPASTVTIVMHDGEIVPLSHIGRKTWHSELWRLRKGIYQITADAEVLDNSTYQITTLPDEPPKIIVSRPDNAVTSIDDNADMLLPVTATVTDDFSVTSVKLKVTLAQGSGEQVQFREMEHPVDRDDSNENRQAVSAALNLTQLGLQPGAELYFFLAAEDNRVNSPNLTTSGTYVVKWPQEGEIDVLPIDTLAMDVLPEYFRSQRQIIIDTEKLLDDQDEISADVFAQQSQNIAIDQKLLRLRYGQFLGEEFDSGIGPAPSEELEGAGEEHEDYHEPEVVNPPSNYDQAIATVAHFHDQEEQATLFDPETTDILKQALAQMWDAELQLRLITPAEALPFEHEALKYIKQVQQRSRIYLARVGFKPTPVDPDRRLSGDLAEIRISDSAPKPATENEMQLLQRFIGALARKDLTGATGILSLEELEDLVASKIAQDSDWLAALAAVKELQADPDCDGCIKTLEGALWRQMQTPVPTPLKPKALSKMARDFENRSNNVDREL